MPGRWRTADHASDRVGQESTASLLASVRAGDAAAKERLARRFLPALQRWARTRIPSCARDLLDTDDFVQITLLKTLDRVKQFDPRGPGSFLAYLRRVLQNEVRDQIRRTARRPQHVPLGEWLESDGPSPLERVLGREALAAYERALGRLTGEQHDAVVLRMELGFTHAEVAQALGLPTPNAARMAVARALVRLTEVLDEEKG